MISGDAAHFASLGGRRVQGFPPRQQAGGVADVPCRCLLSVGSRAHLVWLAAGPFGESARLSRV